MAIRSVAGATVQRSASGLCAIRDWEHRSGMIVVVRVWDELRLEQYAVMISAMEEAYLNNVMDEYGMRLRWAKTGDCRRPSNLTVEAKRGLVAYFAAVVADLIDRGWVEIREPRTGRWDDAAPMSRAEQDTVLHDPASWIIRMDGTHRMVMLMPTDEWVRLVRSTAPPARPG